MTASGERANGNRASTVLGRRLGGELLALRVAAGKTQQQAADALSATATKVVKMERGWVPMRDPDIKALCQFYAVDDAKVVGRMLELAKTDRDRRKVKGWWNDTPAPATQVEYIAMEDGALRVRQWQMALIPGLLQTPEYIRAMCVADMSWDDIDRIEDVVTARAKRQERLYGEVPLRIHAVIWEAALRQLMGGPGVMSGQLAHLCHLAELPNVQIQVLPFRVGAHPCVGGPFNILSFAEDEAVDVVHMDNPRSTIWIEHAQESAVYATLFDRAARASLSPYDSLRFIDSISKGLNE
ncbi:MULTISPECIES: helix-turn-helix transcriptional regulator [unclassified Streptomyces]|uniref:helix-turn-helix domain-containing protein n=1 Tax=unclassified Streptomyces TaxID=2593676 RepID=UPI00081E4331|nr:MULTISPECIES: helix-turn-helix transcriptional regulator [unclassified Streptomyces]MYZ35324.1 helix-turn-helix domain-containing protein [Streptomyces sp. SID4917]SCF74570.1 Helix-turn-helix domain-containing protein [Streptomyces sp. MnatMP-M17]